MNHLDLSFPGALKIQEGDQETWEFNQAFKDYFPELIIDNLANPLYAHSFFKEINTEKKIHWKGILFHVDTLTVNDGNLLYLLSPSKESVSKSFLWMKHDLLNILNPIMGFSDIMATDDRFDPDDQIIFKKIHENSQKMFQQFQKIAQLQKTDQFHQKTTIGDYRLNSFISELVDKLVVDNDLSSEAVINIKYNCSLPEFITQHQFRSIIEDQLSYLCSLQQESQLIINTTEEDHQHAIYFHFPHCELNPQTLEDFEQAENFLAADSSFQKLAIPSLNYLILCELCKLAGGTVKTDLKEHEVILKMVLPLYKTEENDPQIDAIPSQKKKDPIKSYLDIQAYPNELISDLKSLWKDFDGLMILDQWDLLAQEMEKINKKYQNQELEERIQSISKAVKSFDIDTLKNIYANCSQILKE